MITLTTISNSGRFIFKNSKYINSNWPPAWLILNFYKFLNYTGLLIITYFIYYKDTWLCIGYHNLLDNLSRLQVNDFYLNLYYTLWTNAWYLPTLFSIMLFVYVTACSTNPHLIGLIITTSLYFLCINSYNLNLNPFDTINSEDFFNVLLTNSINKYHPFLFYVTLLPITTLVVYSNFTAKKFNYAYNWFIFKKVINIHVLIIIWTLYLGSWWAFQEGSWGGWWNWDSSEVFGLFVMVTYLAFFHQSVSSNSLTVKRSFLITTFLLYCIYFFIQLNFDLVSHNFGTRTDSFIELSQSLTIAYIIVFFLFIYFTVRISNLINQNVLLNLVQTQLSVRANWVTLVGFIIIWTHLNSFAILINDFLLSNFKVNVFNSVTETKYYSPFIIIIMLVPLWKLSFHCGYYLGAIAAGMWVFIATNLLQFNVRTYHWYLLIILSLIMSQNYYNFSTWTIIDDSLINIGWDLLATKTLPHISLNTNSIEVTSSIIKNENTAESIWNFLLVGSSLDIHSFSHTFHSNYITQELISGLSHILYSINVFDLQSSSVNALVLICWLVMIYWQLRTTIIHY